MIAAGEIESVGRDVLFKPGDQVFGMDGFRVGDTPRRWCWPARRSSLDMQPQYEESAALPTRVARLVFHASFEGVKGAGAGLRSFGAIGSPAVKMAGISAPR